MSDPGPTASNPGKVMALAGLVGMSMLWGSTFFSIKALVTQMPVADMLAVRFLIATAAIGVIAWRHWRMTRATLLRGLAIGVLYGSAQLLQTFGLAHTSASRSGFITGLYVVFTPLLAARMLRERVAASTWMAVGLATVGLGVLTLRSGASGIGGGDLLTLACAVVYALHIVCVDRWTTDDTALSLTIVQMAVCAVMAMLAALPGGIALPHTHAQWAWMVYLAVLAGALPIFLQIWAQTRVDSTTAAVIMSGEPVWAAVFAVALGGESPTWQMVVGGAAMLVAMLVVTLAPRRRRAVISPV